jgi:starvation-inducible DNA-binding protein
MTANNHKQHLYPTRIDMSAHTRSQIVGLLNATLATTLDLKTQVKQAHWNVKGMDFYQLHLLFDSMATGSWKNISIWLPNESQLWAV